MPEPTNKGSPAPYDCGMTLAAIEASSKIPDILEDITNAEKIDAVLLFLFAMAASAKTRGMSKKAFWNLVSERIRAMAADSDFMAAHEIVTAGSTS